MSSRSNASGKRPIFSNGGEDNAQPPQSRPPRQPGDSSSAKHASPFDPSGYQGRTLGHMDAAFQTVFDNIQGIKQYAAHLEELLLQLYSPQFIEYHVARLRTRDGVAGSQSTRGRQRTKATSPEHDAADNNEVESLFIPEPGNSGKRRMQSVEAESVSKKARTGLSTSSGAPSGLGESLQSRRSHLDSSSSEAISAKTVRRQSATSQQTPTLRTDSTQGSVTTQKTVSKPASEVSHQTVPARQSTESQSTTAPHITPNQLAQRQAAEHAATLQKVAKTLAQGRSLRHAFYPACIPSLRATSNFQPASKPASKSASEPGSPEITRKSAHRSVSITNTPQTQLSRRDSVQSVDSSSQNKSKGLSAPKPASNARLNPTVSRPAANDRSASSTARSDAARPRPPAPRHDAAAVRSGSHGLRHAANAGSNAATTKSAADAQLDPPVSRSAVDVRPSPPTPRTDARVRSGPPVSRPSTDVRPTLPPKPAADARSGLLAPRRDTAIHSESHNPRRAVDARPDLPAHRPIPPRPVIPSTVRGPSRHVYAPRGGASPHVSRPNTPASSPAPFSPAMRHRLPARPQQWSYQNRPPRF